MIAVKTILVLGLLFYQSLAATDLLDFEFRKDTPLKERLGIVRGRFQLKKMKQNSYETATRILRDEIKSPSIYGCLDFKNFLKFNCEHVVPQSRFCGKESIVMRSDLHHLYGCLESLNTLRANFKFADIDARKACFLNASGQIIQRPLKNDGKTCKIYINQNPEENRFEPNRTSKGSIARACSYFFTRYKNALRFMSEVIDIPTMIKWHEEDPVSAEEMRRDEIIFKEQGNHNPYIIQPANFLRRVWNGLKV